MIDVCIDAGYDGEGPEICQEITRTARKQHECCECDDTIEPGDQYEHAKGLWDGSWDEFRTCRICAAIRRDFCNGFIYGTLWESMRETHGLGPDVVYDDWDGHDYTDEEWVAYVKRQEAKRKKGRTFSSIRFSGRGPGLNLEPKQ